MLQHEKDSNEMTQMTEDPITDLLSLPPDSLEFLMSLATENTAITPEIGSSNSSSTKKRIKNGMEELRILFQNNSLWLRSPTNEGYVLNLENYYDMFSKYSHLRTSSSRIETSKDTLTVPIAALDLFQMFLNMNQWADLFPTIVMGAKYLEAINFPMLEEVASLHLMHVRTHILSPSVGPREFFLYRYGWQEYADTWMIMDASFDYSGEIEEETAHNCCWKFPSGIVITRINDKASLVTWIEHVQVNKSIDHEDPLYRNLFSSQYGFGATRWLSTLERTLERSLYSARHANASPSINHITQKPLSGPVARKNFLNLTHRMIKDLCGVLSMPSRSDLPVPTNGNIRMSIRSNYKLPGQPSGEIISLSTSVWFPLSVTTLFDFLQDVRKRHRWDMMLDQIPVNEMTRFATGSHAGNYASYMEPSMYKDLQVLWLQENSIDRLGALIVYANILKSYMGNIVRGEDTGFISLLPCGIFITGDNSVIIGGGSSDGASSSSGSGRRSYGSVLTLIYQGLGGNDPIGAIKYLNTQISKTIHNLKCLLGCP